MNKNNVAVFVLLGQSNAVGHGVPMEDKDKITSPMKNVFGLKRELNQSYDIKELRWSGYESRGMNLGETQDDTYSVANCLAALWQKEKDEGAELPDLYIVHIAIGAQGVTEGYMWNPKYKKILVGGELGKVNISLFSFTEHILSMVNASLNKLGKNPCYVSMHWRGGENDTTASQEMLSTSLKGIYEKLLIGFSDALGGNIPIVLHRIIHKDRCMDFEPTGEYVKRMHYINEVFEALVRENRNISMFDIRKAPYYIPDVRGNGVFIDDVVHYTPEVNNWVAKEILEDYKKRLR